jgi:hypothetical protein
MRPDTVFRGDDLCRIGRKFQRPRFGPYLAAVQRIDQLAQAGFGKRIIHLAVRWMLDQAIATVRDGATAC